MKHKVYYSLLILVIFGLLFQIQYQGTVIDKQRGLIVQLFADLFKTCDSNDLDKPDAIEPQPKYKGLQPVDPTIQGRT